MSRVSSSKGPTSNKSTSTSTTTATVTGTKRSAPEIGQTESVSTTSTTSTPKKGRTTTTEPHDASGSDVTFEDMFVSGLRALVNTLAGPSATALQSAAKRVQIADPAELESKRKAAAETSPDSLKPVMAPIIGGVVMAYNLGHNPEALSKGTEQFVEGSFSAEVKVGLEKLSTQVFAKTAFATTKGSGSQPLPLTTGSSDKPSALYATNGGSAVGDMLRIAVSPFASNAGVITNTIFPGLAISTMSGFAETVNAKDLAFLVPPEFHGLKTAHDQAIARYQAQEQALKTKLEASVALEQSLKAEIEALKSSLADAEDEKNALIAEQEHATKTTATANDPMNLLD